jgi:hypothetical protein
MKGCANKQAVTVKRWQINHIKTSCLNGSQYLYDEQKSLSVPMQSDAVYIGGVAVPKVIAYGGGALIALALVYKMVKG